MATTATERVIRMRAPTGVETVVGDIQQDALVLQATSLALGNQVFFAMEQGHHLVGNTYTIVDIVTLTFYVILPADDATVTSGIAAMQLRWPGWGITTRAASILVGV
jgi:hypothetical protein